jgi:hypothetical protein
VSEEELGLCFLGSEKTYNFWARTSEVKYSPLHEESLERQKVFFFFTFTLRTRQNYNYNSLKS